MGDDTLQTCVVGLVTA